MKIKITEAKRDQINAIFAQANGKAGAHTLDGEHAFFVAERAESRLEDLGVPKGKRKGTRVTLTPNGPSLSYRYAMRTTSFTLERGASDWFLFSVQPISVWPKSRGGMSLSITEEVAEIIKAVSVAGLAIRKAA